MHVMRIMDTIIYYRTSTPINIFVETLYSCARANNISALAR